MNVIETERLYLRLLTLTDIDVLMNIWGDQKVMKYCGGAGTKERELQALKYYINLQNEKGFSPYLVISKESNAILGVCGFNPPNNGYDTELMYHLDKKYWGKGYATEAGKACLTYAKEKIFIKRISASIDPSNKASENVLKKLGFNYVGMVWCEATKQDEPYFEYIIN